MNTQGALFGFFTMVVDTIARDGWVSKRTAATKLGCEPTVATVCRRLQNRERPSVEAAEKAAAVLVWATTRGANEDEYLAKIGRLARGEIEFNETQLAFAASIPEAYTRAMAPKAAPAAKPAAVPYIGKEGERLTFRVTVERILDLEGAYGAQWLHIMRDAQGRRVVWRCTSYQKRLKPGESYEVKGTVKAHTEYRGEPQTIVTRVAS